MSNIVISNTSFNREKEESKFSIAVNIFYNLGYILTIDDNNNLICSRDDKTNTNWYIADVSSSGITLKNNGALVSFCRDKVVENIETKYEYKFAVANLSKFGKEDIQLLESIIGNMWLYLSRVSND